MRGALIHGVLLVVMLVYGYRTWTRDKTEAPNTGSVVLWDKTDADLVSIEYKAPKKIVKIEKKADYWWGSDITIETKPKPGTGSGSGSGSGSAAKPEEEEVSRKTHEFPLGEAGDKMVTGWEKARALRDLGVPSDDNKKDYKLVDAKTTLTVTFKDGPKTFLIGGSVYGGSDRYAVDQATGKAYVLAKDLISGLEIGETSLHLVDPRGFDQAKLESVTIEAGGKSKTVTRIETEQDGTKRKTWADADTKAPNTLAANFVDGINNLKPTEYATTVKASDMQQILKLTYKGDKGQPLGTLELLRYEKPGTLQEGQELDPANPPKGETEYYIMTEKTKVPGLVRRDQAQRTESDIENVLSGKTEAGSGAGSGSAATPKFVPKDHGGNPLGDVPNHGMGSASPGLPQSPVPTAPGSAAMGGTSAPMGSAAPVKAPTTPPPATPKAPTPPPAPAPATPAAAGSAAN